MLLTCIEEAGLLVIVDFWTKTGSSLKWPMRNKRSSPNFCPQKRFSRSLFTVVETSYSHLFSYPPKSTAPRGAPRHRTYATDAFGARMEALSRKVLKSPGDGVTGNGFCPPVITT